MILWTIQPEEVYELIQNTGVYHCDFSRSMLSDMSLQYNWLVEQMKKRIGDPPTGVTYPVWAGYCWEGARKKPDLRRERWGNGVKGDRFVCLEIDIPDEKVLLSDFDAWSIILLSGLLSVSEKEDDELQATYDALTPEDQWKMMSKNWEDVFNLKEIDNDWVHRGNSIQATFWELRKEQICKVRTFTSAFVMPKRDI